MNKFWGLKYFWGFKNFSALKFLELSYLSCGRLSIYKRFKVCDQEALQIVLYTFFKKFQIYKVFSISEIKGNGLDKRSKPKEAKLISIMRVDEGRNDPFTLYEKHMLYQF